jgi:hypothetical protein
VHLILAKVVGAQGQTVPIVLDGQMSFREVGPLSIGPRAMFVRRCHDSGDRVLGAIILEMVGFTAPRQHYPYLARWPGYPCRGKLYWNYYKLAVMALRTPGSERLPQEHRFTSRVAFSSFQWTTLARNAFERPRLILGRWFASAYGQGYRLLPESELPPSQ